MKNVLYNIEYIKNKQKRHKSVVGARSEFFAP